MSEPKFFCEDNCLEGHDKAACIYCTGMAIEAELARLRGVVEAAWDARHAYFSCAPKKAQQERLKKAMWALSAILGEHLTIPAPAEPDERDDCLACGQPSESHEGDAEDGGYCPEPSEPVEKPCGCPDEQHYQECTAAAPRPGAGKPCRCNGGDAAIGHDVDCPEAGKPQVGHPEKMKGAEDGFPGSDY
jgi:hypothetical protein